MIGRTILNWRIIQKLGSGGMCHVFKAENTSLKGNYVAIKCLKEENFKNEELKTRFETEAKNMMRFQAEGGAHPKIMKCQNFHKETDNYFLIVEFIKGTTLKTFIEEDQGPIPPDKTNDIFRDVLIACKHMHNHNFIHRDLKPDNIMYNKVDGSIKILDFGIAKPFDISEEDNIQETMANMLVGTPKYMSPEQLQTKDLDIRSDIYSLGVILYEMLTGKYCFPGHLKITSLSAEVIKTPLPSVQDTIEYLDAKYDHLIAMATAKNKGDRILNCDEFIKAINKIDSTIDVVFPITIKINEGVTANFIIDGMNERSVNKIIFNGNVGMVYPLTIRKKGYKDIHTNFNVQTSHETNNIIELKLKKKFLGIF